MTLPLLSSILCTIFSYRYGVLPCLESNRQRRLREAAANYRAAKIIAIRRTFPELRAMSLEELVDTIDINTYYDAIPLVLIAARQQAQLNEFIRDTGEIPTHAKFQA